MPVNVAIAGIKSSIVEALSVWEKRIEIVKITHTVTLDRLSFRIIYKSGESVESFFDLIVASGSIGRDTVLADLIIQGIFPTTGERFLVEFGLNNNIIAPISPVGGFGDRISVLNFCNAAYGSYGFWYLQGDRLYCRVKDAKYLTGYIKITALSISRIQVDVPQKNMREFYQVSITHGGAIVYSSNSLNNPNEILVELNTNFLEYGVWQLEQVAGDFSYDFNADFSTEKTVLALYTTNYSTAVLNILTN
jgi:hypothetical protein